MGLVKMKCCECEKKLKKNEVALSKKLLGRDIEEFMCISCLSVYLSCSTKDLEIKMREFKELGCALFL